MVNNKLQSQTNSRKDLEKFINKILDSKIEELPEQLQELIPANWTPEEKLMWLIKAEKGSLFGYSGISTLEMEHKDNTEHHEKELEDTEKDEIKKLEKILSMLLKIELEQFPEIMQDLIPSNYSLKEKYQWVVQAKKKGLVKNQLPMRTNLPLGSAPYSGPGTAPGTGPGTDLPGDYPQPIFTPQLLTPTPITKNEDRTGDSNQNASVDKSEKVANDKKIMQTKIKDLELKSEHDKTDESDQGITKAQMKQKRNKGNK